MNAYDKLSKIVKVGVMSSAIAVVAGAGLTFAAFGSNGSGVDGSNFLTGPYSLNKNLTDIQDQTRVKLINLENTHNNLDYFFNTGKNQIEKNTKVGDVFGGDVNAAFRLNNGAGVLGSTSLGGNYNYNLVGAAVDPTASNSVTGPYSENKNLIDINTSRELKVINKSDISNDINLKANTGNNDIRKNTVVGDVATGNVNISGDIANVSNSNNCITCADVLGVFNGGLSGASVPATSFSNSTTGPDSVNLNKLNYDNQVSALVVNKSNVNNDVNVAANTGKNAVEKNTVVGNVYTGSVNVDLGVSNQ